MITHHPLHHIHQHHSLIGASKVQPNCPLCYGIHHWLASCMKWIKGYRYQYTGTWGIYYIGQPTIKHCRLNKTCEFLLFPTIKIHVWLKEIKKEGWQRDSMHVINGKKKNENGNYGACLQHDKKGYSFTVIITITSIIRWLSTWSTKSGIGVSVILHFFFVDATYQAKGAKQSKRCFSLQSKWHCWP